MPVTITAAELAAEFPGEELPRVERVLPVATQMVGDYAPQAPTALLNEAVIRFAGYLLEVSVGTVKSATLGPYSQENVVNHADAFRRSGAAMLLTRYKKRRGGPIGSQTESAPAPQPAPSPPREGGDYLRWGS